MTLNFRVLCRGHFFLSIHSFYAIQYFTGFVMSSHTCYFVKRSPFLSLYSLGRRSISHHTKNQLPFSVPFPVLLAFSEPDTVFQMQMQHELREQHQACFLCHFLTHRRPYKTNVPGQLIFTILSLRLGQQSLVKTCTLSEQENLVKKGHTHPFYVTDCTPAC